VTTGLYLPVLKPFGKHGLEAQAISSDYAGGAYMSSMYAPHEPAQRLCHRVLSLACPGFLPAADIKDDVGATRANLDAILL
jgi:hypothetical protein